MEWIRRIVHKKALQISILCLVVFFTARCSSVNHRQFQDAPSQPESDGRHSANLTPAQQYAAEVLAYFFKVVVGKAGNPKMRNEWATRGVNAPLDFNSILRLMNAASDHPSGFPSIAQSAVRNKSSYIVQDPNMLPLGEVLYYYDQNLNHYKGKYAFNSIYPSPGLIGLRTLLAKKLCKNEKIRMGPLFARKNLLSGTSKAPTPEDLTAMGLDATEFKLIRDVISAEPGLGSYMENPFLITALLQTGAVETDDYVRVKVRQANYSNCLCRHLAGPLGKKAVKITFLPSVIQEFEYTGNQNANQLKSTPFYQRMQDKLMTQIAEKTKSILIKELKLDIDQNSEQWNRRLDQWFRENVAFYAQDARPLVVYPENADAVLRQVCPETDFAAIILGKNVYLSMDIDPEKHVYPSTNRVYLDIIDIKYTQFDAELASICRFIVSKLKDDLAMIVSSSAARQIACTPAGLSACKKLICLGLQVNPV